MTQSESLNWQATGDRRGQTHLKTRQGKATNSFVPDWFL